jgi:hypothetical protein
MGEAILKSIVVLLPAELIAVYATYLLVRRIRLAVRRRRALSTAAEMLNKQWPTAGGKWLWREWMWAFSEIPTTEAGGYRRLCEAMSKSRLTTPTWPRVGESDAKSLFSMLGHTPPQASTRRLD